MFVRVLVVMGRDVVVHDTKILSSRRFATQCRDLIVVFFVDSFVVVSLVVLVVFLLVRDANQYSLVHPCL